VEGNNAGRAAGLGLGVDVGDHRYTQISAQK
jgi:hypothetical protein